MFCINVGVFCLCSSRGDVQVFHMGGSCFFLFLTRSPQVGYIFCEFVRTCARYINSLFCCKNEFAIHTNIYTVTHERTI